MVNTFQAARGVNCLDLCEQSTPVGIRAHLPCDVLNLEWIPCSAWTLNYDFTLIFAGKPLRMQERITHNSTVTERRLTSRVNWYGWKAKLS